MTKRQIGGRLTRDRGWIKSDMPSKSGRGVSHLEGEFFRLIFLVACLLYIWFQSLFRQSSHAILGDRHVFAYNRVGIALRFGFNIIPIGERGFCGVGGEITSARQ